MTKEPESPTAFIYLRVSSQGQVNRAHDPEGYSIPAQRDACTAFAAQTGCKVVGEYAELGRTGRTMNRPELQKMLDDVKTLHPDYVIVYDLSRLSRDELDGLWLVRKLEKDGCAVKSTTEHIDPSDSGKFLTTIMFGQHAFRSRGDATKIKLGMNRKHSDGGTNGPAPYGYRNVQHDISGRRVAAIEIDPDQGPLIRMAFDLMATGDESISTVLNVVNAAGFTTKATPSRPSKPLSRSSFARLLRSSYYIGQITRRGVTVTGRHDPLISQETFDRVQIVLDTHRQGGVRTKYKPHYLAGSAYCGKCGVRLGWASHRSGSGVHFEYFSCLSRSRPTGACGAKYISSRQVERTVEDLHARQWLTPDEQESLQEEFAEWVQAKTAAARDEGARHERRLKTLLTQQQKLVQLFYKDTVSDEVLAAEQKRIASEQAEAKRWLETARDDAADLNNALDEVFRLLDTPADAYRLADKPIRRLLNLAIFEQIQLWLEPDGDADVDAYDIQKIDATLESRSLRVAPVLTPLFSQVRALARGHANEVLQLAGSTSVRSSFPQGYSRWSWPSTPTAPTTSGPSTRSAERDGGAAARSLHRRAGWTAGMHTYPRTCGVDVCIPGAAER